MNEQQILGEKQSGGGVRVKTTEGGVLANLPYNILWTAKGYGKQAMSTAAVAALVVRPSTTSAITIYNPSSNSINLVIERVFAHNLVTAIEENGGLWLCSHPRGMTAPTGNNITIRNSTNGLAAGGSAVIFDTAESVANDGWFPWGQSEWTNLDGTVPGGQLDALVRGSIIVPPGAGLSVQVVASTTGNTYTHGAHWFEVPSTELLVA